MLTMFTTVVRSLLVVVVLGCAASADTIYNVTLNTAPLIGHPAGPFAVELQFNDGNGAGDANNTALLSGFLFGGGGPSGAPMNIGGVAGNLASSITMSDSSFFNQLIQNFVPGGSLAFQLSLTTNLDSGGVPDEFSLSILDSSGFEIPTLGPANALLIIDIDSSTPTVSAFRADASLVPPGGGGPPIDIAAPQITPVVSRVPEPGSLPLLTAAFGFMLGAAFLRNRQRTSVSDLPQR